MPVPPSRLKRAALTAAIASLGLVCVLAGLDRESLVCERERGRCELTRGVPGLRTTQEIDLGQIRGRDFVRSHGRNGARGVTVLLDARGAELRVAADGEAAAREKFDALARFLDGEGARVEIATEPSLAVLVIGALFILAAPLAWRSGPAAAPAVTTSPAAAASPSRARVLVFVVAAAVLAVAGTVAAALLGRSQGTLELRCTHRCEVGGLTCAAGSATSMTLPPGEHEVRVFTPDVPGSWTSRRVTMVAGQVTNFTCAP